MLWQFTNVKWQYFGACPLGINTATPHFILNFTEDWQSCNCSTWNVFFSLSCSLTRTCFPNSIEVFFFLHQTSGNSSFCTAIVLFIIIQLFYLNAVIFIAFWWPLWTRLRETKTCLHPITRGQRILSVRRVHVRHWQFDQFFPTLMFQLLKQWRFPLKQ